MDIIAAKLDAMQQQLVESKQDFAQLQAGMALLQTTLTKQGRACASSDEPQQRCRKLARWADFCVCPLDRDEILDAVLGYVGLG
jgi:hypothetical protein